MKKFLIWTLRAVLALLLFKGAGYLCNLATHTFSIAAIRPAFAASLEWRCAPPSLEEEKEILAALSQPYTYASKGGQVYVFFSQDGKYVLKFLKQRLYVVPKWLEIFPFSTLFSSYKEKKSFQKKEKRARDFSSYLLAATEIKEHTGVLYLQLNADEARHYPITLLDPLHICHKIDLFAFPFILQKRALRIYDQIEQAMQRGDVAYCYRLIDQIIALELELCKKGIRDRDSVVDSNDGIIDGRVVKIDVGRLLSDERVKSHSCAVQEIEGMLVPFRSWLKQKYPLLDTYLENKKYL